MSLLSLSSKPAPFLGHLADDITMFFLWALTKAIFIGIPLWIMLRIAARQARREQYEQYLRDVAYESNGSNRRMVYRVQQGREAIPPHGMQAV